MKRIKIIGGVLLIIALGFMLAHTLRPNAPSHSPAVSRPALAAASTGTNGSVITTAALAAATMQAPLGQLPPRPNFLPAEKLLATATTLALRELPTDQPNRHQRQRLVKADFKYSLLRVVETVHRDAQTGAETVQHREVAVADHVMVRVSPQISASDLTALATRLGGNVRKKMYSPHMFLVAFAEPTLDTLPDRMRELLQIPGIELAEPDYINSVSDTTPNDTNWGLLWGLHNTGQTNSGQVGIADADIDAPAAWDITTGDTNIIVGVIDTGVDFTHPDLAANAWVNPGEIPDNGIDDDGNGFIDDIYGWDFFSDDNDPMDDNSHGTHCAGTIGGTGNNNLGVVGVCWNVKIMGLKFLGGSGSGSSSDAVDAVNYATRMRVRLTSNSWGGGGYLQSLYDAIATAGQSNILFVAAAGNYSSDNDTSTFYPSSFANLNIISVAATDNRDALANFSNFGATSVDIGAPGVAIYSTTLNNGYGNKSGTSMATPQVSGACALAFARKPDATWTEIKQAILNGAEPIPALSGKCVTGARLNVFDTLQLLEVNVLVTPLTATVFTGPDGGPFTPATNTYVIANIGTNTFSWTATKNNPNWFNNVTPASGTLAPGQSNILVVTLRSAALNLAPGNYSGTISFSTPAVSAAPVIRYVTLQVLDSLSVTPAAGFTAIGPEGGPFSPNSQVYVISNRASTARSWAGSSSANWLTMPTGGVLPANAATNVTVALNTNAANLPPGRYATNATFSNLTAGTSQSYTVSLRAGVDDFTELFSANDNDLDNQSWTFTPNGSGIFYAACHMATTAFPTDPTGGTTVSLPDDGSVKVTLTGGKSVALYGTTYTNLFICSNGYLTFGSGDSENDESITAHFSRPRISALFDDLNPATGGTVSHKQLGDRFVVTFQNIRQFYATDSNSFQIELFFNGIIRLSYLAIAAPDGLVGLSAGSGVPVAFEESAFSSYDLCPVPTDLALSLAGAPNPVGIGSNLTYTISVTNLGAVTATAVTVTNILPASVTFVSASPGCTYSAGKVICNLGTLAGGARSNINIHVTPTLRAIITNTAAVTSATEEFVFTNNAAVAVTSVTGATSTNAHLANLGLSTGTLSPVFASNIFSYTSTVPYATTNLTVTGTVADLYATLTGNGNPLTSGIPSAPISLSLGTNGITIVVTAENGSTTKTYFLTVTRAAPSTNAYLSNLVPNIGTFTPAFNSNTISYAATVPSAANSMTVKPTAADPYATITVNGNPVASGSNSVSISLSAVGATTITNVVTAQDGITRKTYLLTVTRAGGSIWANVNVTNTPVSPLNWFNAPQGTWTGGTPVSTNNWTIQFFPDTNTALPNTVATHQISTNDNGGVALELGILTLSGRASTNANANLTNTISGDPLNFSAASGTINLDGVNNTRTLTYDMNCPIQLGTASSASALTFGGNGSGTFRISGNITELQPGGGSLIKSGSSAVILSGSNTYSGGTTLNGGTVTVNNGSGIGTSSITVSGSSTVNLSTKLTLPNDITVNAALSLKILMTTSTTNIFSGVLSGSSNISILNIGTGSVIGRYNFTSENNPFTGDVTMASGNAIGYDQFSFNSIGDGGKFTLQKSGNQNIIVYTGASNIVFHTRGLNLGAIGGMMDGGNLTPVNRFANDGSGTVTFKQNLTVAGVTANAAGSYLFFGGSNPGTNTFAGIIPNATSGGNLSIGKSDAGTWILTGDNTFLGNVKVSAGTLSVGKIAPKSTNQPLGKGTIIELGHQSTAGTLEFTGTTNSATDKRIQLGNPNANGGSKGGAVILNNGSGSLSFTNATFNPTVATVIATRPLTLGGTYSSSTGANEIRGTIQNNTNTGAVSLTVAGSIWKISGTNTYAGATAVTAGTLLVNGNNSAATNWVTVSAGGTLGGTGTIGGPVTNLAGSKLAPGAGGGVAGTLTLTNGLDVNGAILSFIITNATAGKYSRVAVTGGSLVANGVNYIQLIAATNQIPNGTYVLITNVTARTPSANQFVFLQSGTTNWTIGGATLTLLDEANSVALTVTGGPVAPVGRTLHWRGNLSGTWDDANLNWTNRSLGAAAAYTEGDNVIFDDLASTFTVSNGAAYSPNPGATTFNITNNHYDLLVPLEGLGDVTKNGSGRLAFTNSLGLDRLTLNGGALSNSVTATLSNAVINLAANAELGSASGTTLTVNGPITNVGGLTKAGAGILALGANNTYTGDTTISGGTLSVGNNSAGTLGGGNYAGNIAIASGATLRIWSTVNFTNTGVISGAGNLLKAYGGSLTLSTNNTYRGKTSLMPQSTAGFTVNVASFNSVNGGAPLLTSSSFGAPTNVANGTIEVGDGGKTAGVVLRYTGAGETTDRVINLNFNGGSQQTLQADVTGGGLLKFTSPLTVNPSTGTTGGGLILRGSGNGEIVGAIPTLPGQLIKNDAGIWTISSVTNRGATTVIAGTLLINGVSAVDTNVVTVATNATFGGKGTIHGTVNYRDGSRALFTVAPDGSGYNNSNYMTFTNAAFLTNVTVKVDMPAALGNGVYVLATNHVGFTTSGSLTFAPNSGSLGAGGSGVVSVAGNNLVLTVSGVTGGGGPTLTSVSPNPVTGSSYPVTLGLVGSGFNGATSVLLTNLTALIGGSYVPTVNSDASISVSFVPGTAATEWNATVVNGTPSAQVGFTVTVPTSVTINPASLKSAGAGNVVLSGGGGQPGHSYAVMSKTNLVLGVWLPVVTNTFDGSGNFSYTNTVSPGTPQLFLRINQ